MLKNKVSFLLFFAIIPGFLQSPASADPLASERVSATLREEQYATGIEQAKDLDNQLRKKEAGAAEDLVFRTGGWTTATYRYYKDIDNQKAKEDFLKWSWQNDFYLWAYLKYKKTYSAYVRLYDTYYSRGVGLTYTGIGDDNEGPLINSAYVQMDLAPEFSVPVKWTVGRQYLYIGRGIVYSDINDGIQIESATLPLYQKYFAARTRPREDNLDFSVPNFDKNGQRYFFGGEMAYLGFPDTTLYGFYLYQKDQTEENPGSWGGQKFRYDSYYYGGGFTKTWLKFFETWSEVMLEKGQGYTDTLRADPAILMNTGVDAWAFVTGAKYRFDTVTHPILEAEYARGTGDAERARVTNTATGGDIDTSDQNFLYFGYYLAGYALQPRLSNLNILSLGGSLSPLEFLPHFNHLAVGSKYYFYWKDEAKAGTSDFESVSNSADVGREWDVYLHWQITDRLKTSVRYGIFWPGGAFPEITRDNTEYFSASATLSF